MTKAGVGERARSVATRFGRAMVLLGLALCAVTRAGAEGELLVNPPEWISPELRPYVSQFQKALEGNGFTFAGAHAGDYYDLRVTFESGVTGISISSELLQGGRVLVATPTRNRTLAKQSSIPETAEVAARRFSQHVSRYVAAADLRSAAGASSGATAAAASPPAGAAVEAAPVAAAPLLATAAPTTAAISAAPARSAVSSAKDVKVFFRPPDAPYDELGILEASSKSSWSFSNQGKIDKAVERLKEHAFRMGANGLLLQGIGSEVAGTVNSANGRITSYGNTAYGTTMGSSVAVMHKTASAIAIFVHPPQARKEASVPAVVTAEPAPAASSATQRTNDVYDAILKLDDLRRRGLISNEEFEAEKRKILATP